MASGFFNDTPDPPRRGFNPFQEEMQVISSTMFILKVIFIPIYLIVLILRPFFKALDLLLAALINKISGQGKPPKTPQGPAGSKGCQICIPPDDREG